MASVEHKIVLADENDMRLDRWFHLYYPGVSFSALQKLLRSGQIRVDGCRAKAATRLLAHQTVRIPPLASGAEPIKILTKNTLKSYDDDEALKNMLLYEDEHMFIFNKPAQLAVQGGSGVTRHVDGMLEAWRNKKGEKPRLVHRIDRDTSGLLIVARSRLSAQTLTTAFKKRQIKKVYWAVVRGLPPHRQGRISNWLCKKTGTQGDYMEVCPHGAEGAQHAISHYRIIEHVPRSVAWLELQPHTGRTHQLRVHMAFLNTPILGDSKYFFCDSNWVFPGGVQNKLHLHARSLTFDNLFGKSFEISAPLPPHMQQTFNLFGFDEEAVSTE